MAAQMSPWVSTEANRAVKPLVKLRWSPTSAASPVSGSNSNAAVAQAQRRNPELILLRSTQNWRTRGADYWQPTASSQRTGPTPGVPPLAGGLSLTGAIHPDPTGLASCRR